MIHIVLSYVWQASFRDSWLQEVFGSFVIPTKLLQKVLLPCLRRWKFPFLVLWSKTICFFFQRPYRCPVSNYLRALLVSFYFHAKFVMKFSVSALQEAPFGLLSCHGVLSLVEPSFLNMCGSRGIMLYSWPYKRIVKLPRSITIWLQLLVAS